MAGVLTIDWDEASSMDLVREIADSDHTVVSVAGLDQAMRMYRSSAIDVVIVDLLGPVGQGMEIILEFKRVAPGLPIIAIAGDGLCAARDTLMMARHLGAIRTHAKPIRAEQLLDSVAEVAPKAGMR